MSDPKVSIVIINYNYAKHVGAAIRSALATDYENKEVIVVDDGSTDDSRSIISSFHGQIHSIFKPNGGQISGANVAVQHVTGDVVFFLDSDDELYREAIKSVMEVWRDGVSKVQFPLNMMSEDGALSGEVYPNLVERTPAEIRESVKLTGFYLSSPTSGNAWSKRFLDRIFPLPTDSDRLKFFDGYLSTLAPFLGDVITLTSPLAKYRVNSSNMWTKKFSPAFVVENCLEDIERADLINRKLVELEYRGALKTIDPTDNYSHMMKRLVGKRFFANQPPFSEEGGIAIVRRSFHDVLVEPNLSAKTKAMLLVWFAAVAVLPKSLAIYLVKMRFVATYRPAFVNFLLVMSGWRRRSQLMSET
jgi:glycosyltransferase involved in cell wall biosynthesis